MLINITTSKYRNLIIYWNLFHFYVTDIFKDPSVDTLRKNIFRNQTATLVLRNVFFRHFFHVFVQKVIFCDYTTLTANSLTGESYTITQNT
jgi:hypothetical protein